MARNFSPIYCLNLGTKSWFPDWSGWLPWPGMWCWWCWLVGRAATICSWVDGVTSLSRSMPNYRVTAPSFNGVHIACSGADIIGIRAKQLHCIWEEQMQERALFELCRASITSASGLDTRVCLLKSELQFAVYFIRKCGLSKRTTESE